MSEKFASLNSPNILERFASSRKTLEANPYRPVYHFVPPEGFSNDPNGLCFWQGKWHLFYQALPPGRQHPNWSWGHAVSDDLVHWKDLPYAIEPGPEEGSWSGATFVEDDRVIAMYFGFGRGNMVATASDPELLHWEKVTNDAVIPNPDLPIFMVAKGGERCGNTPLPQGALNFVYDACIWKKGDFYYSIAGGSMVGGTAQKRQRTGFLFRSADLANWEYMHSFIEGDIYGSAGDDLGCPYFWPIGDQHILMHFSHRGASHYMIGDYDKENDKFLVRNGGHFGFGPTFPGGVLAPSATPDGNGNVITLFNIAPGCWSEEENRNQVISLPRKLSLKDGDLCIEPIPAMSSLRQKHVGLENLHVAANQELVLDPEFSGDTVEIELEVSAHIWSVFEMNILRSPDREEYTSIRFYRDRGFREWDRAVDPNDCWSAPLDSVVSIDTSHSSTWSDVQCRAPESGSLYLPVEENLKLHIFIDRCIVEVFVNDRLCLTSRVYPGRKDSRGISFYVNGRDAEIKKLDLWQLSGIYGK